MSTQWAVHVHGWILIIIFSAFTKAYTNWLKRHQIWLGLPKHVLYIATNNSLHLYWLIFFPPQPSSRTTGYIKNRHCNTLKIIPMCLLIVSYLYFKQAQNINFYLVFFLTTWHAPVVFTSRWCCSRTSGATDPSLCCIYNFMKLGKPLKYGWSHKGKSNKEWNYLCLGMVLVMVDEKVKEKSLSPWRMWCMSHVKRKEKRSHMRNEEAGWKNKQVSLQFGSLKPENTTWTQSPRAKQQMGNTSSRER